MTKQVESFDYIVVGAGSAGCVIGCPPVRKLRKQGFGLRSGRKRLDAPL
jgi:hypothetical protein